MGLTVSGIGRLDALYWADAGRYLGAQFDHRYHLAGAWFLVGYSLGLGVLFLAFASALERADRLFRSLTRHLRAFQMVTGTFWRISPRLFNRGVGRSPSLFLSPCVLPLVSAAVFYLTGRTFSKATAR
jgi:cytochrome c biogenesis protein CcdA